MVDTGDEGGNADEDGITRLFVYGTLRPGEARWPALSEYVDSYKRAVLRGWTIFALPEGYPAIVPSSAAGEGRVVGDLLELEPDLAVCAIQTADRIEAFKPGDADSLYRRIVVEIDASAAHTYEYHPDRHADARTRGSEITSGDWKDHSKRVET